MEFLSEIRWLPLFFEFFLKSTLILSLALQLAFLLQKRTAAARHLTLSLFFIGLLFLPILSVVTNGWETKLLPSRHKSNDVRISADIQLVPTSSEHSFRNSNMIASDSLNAVVENIEVTGPNFLSTLSEKKDPVGTTALLFWAAGLGLLMFRLSLGLYGAFCLTREGDEIKETIWHRLLYRFLTAVSLKRRISLLSHKKVLVPLTWGVFKPVIMMPAEAETWTEDQRSSALFHELSHVKRADFLVMLLARVSLAIFWLNPLSWVVFRMIKKEQEKACDELVLKTGIKPSTYAAHLLAIRRSLPIHWNPPTAVLGAMGRSQLDDRLTTILRKRLKLKETNMRTKMALGILVILSIAFIGMARPSTPAIDESVLDLPVQETAVEPISVQTQEQTKKKTKKTEEKAAQKEKAEKEEAVMTWTTKASEEDEVQITIVEKDGTKKSFTITSPAIYISKSGDGKKIHIMTSPHLELKKDEKGNYAVISSGKVHIDEAHLDEIKNVIKIEDGAVVTIKTKDKDGTKVIELDAPEIHIQTVHAAPDVHVEKVHVDPDVHIETVHVDSDVHTETEMDFGKSVNVNVHSNIRSSLVNEINKKQLKKIEEILKKANEGAISQEIALKEIEEAVAEMNEKMERTSEELKQTNVYVHTAPKAFSIRHSTKEHAEAKANVWVMDTHDEGKADVRIMDKKEGNVIATIHDDGAVTIVFHDKYGSENKQKFEQVAARLQENLPEGYKLESKFHEDDSTYTITVTGVEKDEDREGTVKKIIETLKKELGKIKE